MRKVIAIMLIVCGFGLGYFVVPSYIEYAPWNDELSDVQKGNDKAVTERMAYIADLSVLDYKFASAANYSSSKKFKRLLKNLNIPFTKKQIVMLYDGDIKIGVDADKITADVKRGLTGIKEVTIGLPPLKITSNSIERDSIEFPLEQNGLLNSIKASDYGEVEKQAKKKMAKEIKKDGIMDRAKAELESKIKGYLTALYGRDVEITFKDIK